MGRKITGFVRVLTGQNTAYQLTWRVANISERHWCPRHKTLGCNVVFFFYRRPHAQARARSSLQGTTHHSHGVLLHVDNHFLYTHTQKKCLNSTEILSRSQEENKDLPKTNVSGTLYFWEVGTAGASIMHNLSPLLCITLKNKSHKTQLSLSERRAVHESHLRIFFVWFYSSSANMIDLILIIIIIIFSLFINNWF